MAAPSGKLLGTKTLGDVMRPDSLVTVDQEATVLEAARAMTARGVRIVGVLEGNRFVGVLSERDVVRRVVARALDAAHTRVGDVMTGGVVAADSGDDCLLTLRRMEAAGIGHVPVMAEGHVLSMLSIRDLLQIEGARLAGERCVKGLAEI